jgi:hypothetical protein
MTLDKMEERESGRGRGGRKKKSKKKSRGESLEAGRLPMSSRPVTKLWVTFVAIALSQALRWRCNVLDLPKVTSYVLK